MSVILDALHKARGDRRAGAAEPHEQTVARVVDAGLAPQGTLAPTPARSGGGRGWLIAMGVACGLICLVALVGGAFFLLYDQMRRIETVASKPIPAAPARVAAGQPGTVVPEAAALSAPAGVIVTPAAVLQTPVPLAELPVQAPVAAAAPVADPAFELGSIVCENSDCIASLNGRSVRVGDTVKGYKVTKIESFQYSCEKRSYRRRKNSVVV